MFQTTNQMEIVCFLLNVETTMIFLPIHWATPDFHAKRRWKNAVFDIIQFAKHVRTQARPLWYNYAWMDNYYHSAMAIVTAEVVVQGFRGAILLHV